MAALSVALGAYERPLDPGSINQAIAIGISTSDPDRARFHRPYHVDIGRAPVDWIDVITPFRRVVLGAERHTRDGGRLYGQRDAMALLATAPEQLDIVVELTFHPLNTYVGVPPYTVLLVRGDARVEPASLERVPRFGPRMTGTPLPYPFGGGARLPLGTEPLLGGVVAAHFEGSSLALDGTYDVVVSEGQSELARARVNFGALR
ncbi:MAG: hypothetical protein AB7P99_06855 [Vicinamibacterales bacterium]